MYLNNVFAFASIHVGTALENDRSLLGVRADICKVNGDFRFCFSDLKPPPNAQRPLFLQTYTIPPEIAVQHRKDNLQSLSARIQIDDYIWDELEKIMRMNPFGRTFKTAAERIQEEEERTGNSTPEFKVFS